MKKRALSFSMLALSAASFADVPLTQTLVELSAETSQLSNNNPDWHSESLRVARKPGQRDVKELTLTQTRRFDLADQQISRSAVCMSRRSLTNSRQALAPASALLTGYWPNTALMQHCNKNLRLPGWPMPAWATSATTPSMSTRPA